MVDDIALTTESRRQAEADKLRQEIDHEYAQEMLGLQGNSTLSAQVLEFYANQERYFIEMSDAAEAYEKERRMRHQDMWLEEQMDERAEMANNGQFDLMDIATEKTAQIHFNEETGRFEAAPVTITHEELHKGAVVINTPDDLDIAKINAQGGLELPTIDLTNVDIEQYNNTAVQIGIDASYSLVTSCDMNEYNQCVVEELEAKGASINKEDSGGFINFDVNENLAETALTMVEGGKSYETNFEEWASQAKGNVSLFIEEDGSYTIMNGVAMSIIDKDNSKSPLSGNIVTADHATVTIDGQRLDIGALSPEQLKTFQEQTGITVANANQDMAHYYEVLDRHTPATEMSFEPEIGIKMTFDQEPPMPFGQEAVAPTAVPGDSTDEGGETDQEGTKDPSGPEQAISVTDGTEEEQELNISMADGDEFTSDIEEAQETERELVESGAIEEPGQPDNQLFDVKVSPQGLAPEFEATVAAHQPVKESGDASIADSAPPPPPPPGAAAGIADLGSLAPPETPQVTEAGNTASYSSPAITIPPSLQGVNDNDLYAAIEAMKTVGGFGVTLSYAKADHSQPLMPTAGGKAMPEPDKDKEREDDPFSAFPAAASGAAAIG